MRRAAAGAISVLAVSLGLAMAWPVPAVAQTYQKQAPVETAPPAGEGPETMRVPRRRPASAEEIKPAADPALSDQCLWLGQRIISLLIRDDAIAAGDFSPFYTRFGCPEDHLKLAFGCLVANLLTLDNSALADQAEECWRDPSVRYVPLGNGKGASEGNRGKGEPPPVAAPVPPPSN